MQQYADIYLLQSQKSNFAVNQYSDSKANEDNSFRNHIR